VFVVKGFGFAEGLHIGAQVVKPDRFGIVLFSFAPSKKEHVGFNALGIENAGRQP
jgi:hypothetical protein